jgi:hypothetical protein
LYALAPAGLAGLQYDLLTRHPKNLGNPCQQRVIRAAIDRWGMQPNFQRAVVFADAFGFLRIRLDMDFQQNAGSVGATPFGQGHLLPLAPIFFRSIFLLINGMLSMSRRAHKKSRRPGTGGGIFKAAEMRRDELPAHRLLLGITARL